MVYSTTEDELIKKTLTSAQTVAMVGVSSIKKEEVSSRIWLPCNTSKSFFSRKRNIWGNCHCSVRRYYYTDRYC